MSQLSLSYEFFPPRSEAQQRRFWCTLGCLQTLNPAYISMTWGALGSTSAASLEILEHLVKDATVPVTAHLSCSGQTEAQMKPMIEKLEALGITRFLALRGDVPAEASGHDATLSHASHLVSLLAQDPRRDISVAAYPEVHPESASAESDMKWLKHKLDAGAKRAITQFFFEADTFLRFRDKAVATGITQTLVPGILPIHDIQKVADFSSRCGATVPDHLIERFGRATTEESRYSAAVEQCVNLCQRLRQEGVNEFHLYTLNQSTLSSAVSTELMGKSVESIVAA
ncbi:methylenetetrahydrofolate reductase [Granulosicoccus antarcticus]|uniref:Methylenetetrahydrofolate reductase n=1 Tax=Granulosicoccus antarcticus IMCC3135 TaxID=1192854 RepID=A0A2Z2P0G2_9GAMM|nr:methylenetetrahydrofolate reductase [Granulosicoccus antarcticus]ASJ74630.1 5,10-methylenetetrahydrofolate reductase [Granulosicoccus antarcticus IMCC3135]